MEWMILPLQRYADFQGRSRRKEYWMFTLGIFLVFMILAIILMMAFGMGASVVGGDGTGNDDASALVGMFGVGGIAIFVLLYVAILIPSIAVQVRRFHDQDKSGWLVLLNFIPYIGSIVVFVFMLLEGTRGPNRFGPDPKNPEGDLGSVFS